MLLRKAKRTTHSKTKETEKKRAKDSQNMLDTQPEKTQNTDTHTHTQGKGQSNRGPAAGARTLCKQRRVDSAWRCNLILF